MNRLETWAHCVYAELLHLTENALSDLERECYLDPDDLDEHIDRLAKLRRAGLMTEDECDYCSQRFECWLAYPLHERLIIRIVFTVYQANVEGR